MTSRRGLARWPSRFLSLGGGPILPRATFYPALSRLSPVIVCFSWLMLPCARRGADELLRVLLPSDIRRNTGLGTDLEWRSPESRCNRGVGIRSRRELACPWR